MISYRFMQPFSSFIYCYLGCELRLIYPHFIKGCRNGLIERIIGPIRRAVKVLALEKNLCLNIRFCGICLRWAVISHSSTPDAEMSGLYFAKSSSNLNAIGA